MASICLAMIVKNEEKIIKRCLQSVSGLIDYWVICDTGSEDKTKEIIIEEMEGIEGELFEDEWVDYGHNRSLSLERAKGKADYTLVMDADFIMLATEKIERIKNNLAADAYSFKVNDFDLNLLFNNRKNWRYIGKAHEYPSCDGDYSSEPIKGLRIFHTAQGSNRANKGERERELLLKDLDAANNLHRTHFYLGQNYADAGIQDKAIEHYNQSIQLNPSPEERFVAQCRISSLTTAPQDWFKAMTMRPQRYEPYLALAKIHNQRSQHHLGFMFAKAGIELEPCSDLVFNAWESERWELYDQLSVSCYWLQRFDSGLKALGTMMRECRIPRQELQRIRENYDYYWDMMVKSNA
jgi:glycosyltransferase involved in cell wall biosynthesis